MSILVTLPELTWEADDRSFFFARCREEGEAPSEAMLEAQALALHLVEPEGTA